MAASLAAPVPCTLVGTAGDDILRGTGGPDVICGLGGDDTLVGLGGDDVLRGNSGDDVLRGGPGDDRVAGGRGDDRVLGQAGDDIVRGDMGDDEVVGGPGDDRLGGFRVRQRWAALKHRTFVIEAPEGRWRVRLSRVGNLASCRPRDSHAFSLTFRTSRRGPAQGSYVVRRTGFRATTLFLVPSDEGRLTYEAVVFRKP